MPQDEMRVKHSPDPRGCRRLKLLSVPEELLLHAMRVMFGDLPECLSVPVEFTNVPPGCIVAGVKYSFETLCFVFLLEHCSFSIVEEGANIPQLMTDPVWRTRVYHINKETQDAAD